MSVGPELVRLSDIEPEEVRFLWRPYIPLGKVTLLESDPGLGKTWLSLALGAAVSRGAPLPGEDGVPAGAREPASVLYLSAEDGLADTLRPRLDRAGADVERIVALTGIKTAEGRLEALTLEDLTPLELALADVRPALVVVDPIQGYLGAGVDMHRANETRPVLAGLARLAEHYGCAVLVVRHLRKSSTDRAVYRGLGSIDFAAAARSILLVGEDPEEPTRRIIAHAKSNLTPPGPSIVFELRDDEFHWAGTSTARAEDLLRPHEGESGSPRDEAVEFLRELLEHGPVPTKAIQREARAAGLSWPTVERAKKRLGIRAHRSGGFAGDGAWLWSLPNGHLRPSRPSHMNGDGLTAETSGERVSGPNGPGGDGLSEDELKPDEGPWQEPFDP